MFRNKNWRGHMKIPDSNWKQ